MSFYLHENEPVVPGLRRIAHEQIAIAVGNFADDTLPVAKQVHALRARCKKMRGLLRLAQPLMADAFAAEDGRFRAAAQALADFRDRHVYYKALRALGANIRIEDEGEKGVPHDAIERALTIMCAAQAAVDRWPLSDRDLIELAQGFADTYRHCIRNWEAVLQEPDDEKFHKLRKWIKYHWYQVRILERLSEPELRERRKRLRALQLTLGEAHDLVLLQDFLSCRETADVRLLQRASERKNELYAEATLIAHQVFAISAQDLLASMTRSWSNRRH
jgi:CHAD domain-containing protein